MQIILASATVGHWKRENSSYGGFTITVSVFMTLVVLTSAQLPKNGNNSGMLQLLLDMMLMVEMKTVNLHVHHNPGFVFMHDTRCNILSESMDQLNKRIL